MGKWISVHDALPGYGRVLVYSPEYPHDASMAYRLVDFGFVRSLRDVTHWMFLPEPPKD